MSDKRGILGRTYLQATFTPIGSCYKYDLFDSCKAIVVKEIYTLELEAKVSKNCYLNEYIFAIQAMSRETCFDKC